jgi:hypothetical protein
MLAEQIEDEPLSKALAEDDVGTEEKVEEAEEEEEEPSSWC